LAFCHLAIFKSIPRVFEPRKPKFRETTACSVQSKGEQA
jgi:hypothetical protein